MRLVVIAATASPGVRMPTRFSGSAPLTAISSSAPRSEEHTSELQSRLHLVCRLLLEKKKIIHRPIHSVFTDLSNLIYQYMVALLPKTDFFLTISPHYCLNPWWFDALSRVTRGHLRDL